MVEGEVRFRLKVAILVLVMGVWASGCAAPLKTTVSDVAKDPARFRNKSVEVSGQVLRNVVEGDVYATWHLILAGDGEQVVCHEEGWNTGVLRQGWDLAERAKEDGGEVVVSGTVRVQHREMERGERVDLRSISYDGQLIQTDYGDYAPIGWAGPYWGPYFYSPRFWPYYYGPFFPRHRHFPHYYPYYWYYVP